jgi:hypothetical protein
MSSAEGANFSEAAPNKLNIPLSRSAHRVGKSTHLFRRSLIDSYSFVFFSVLVSTLVLSSFVSWSKRHELSSKFDRASFSSSLNLVFWDRDSARELSVVCSRIVLSSREVSSSFIFFLQSFNYNFVFPVLIILLHSQRFA